MLLNDHTVLCLELAVLHHEPGKPLSHVRHRNPFTGGVSDELEYPWTLAQIVCPVGGGWGRQESPEERKESPRRLHSWSRLSGSFRFSIIPEGYVLLPTSQDL